MSLFQPLAVNVICVLIRIDLCSLTNADYVRECLIEKNWRWLVTFGFWTGCSNILCPCGGAGGRVQNEWESMGFHPQDVIFCQVI